MSSSPEIELYQAEWCPYSSVVREALTELDQPYIAIPVPPQPDDRKAMLEATGTDIIPAIRFSDGTTLNGDAEDIVRALREKYPPGPYAAEHERMAAIH
jgi:glutathione S-transferase